MRHADLHHGQVLRRLRPPGRGPARRLGGRRGSSGYLSGRRRVDGRVAPGRLALHGHADVASRPIGAAARQADRRRPHRDRPVRVRLLRRRGSPRAGTVDRRPRDGRGRRVAEPEPDRPHADDERVRSTRPGDRTSTPSAPSRSASRASRRRARSPTSGRGPWSSSRIRPARCSPRRASRRAASRGPAICTYGAKVSVPETTFYRITIGDRAAKVIPIAELSHAGWTTDLRFVASCPDRAAGSEPEGERGRGPPASRIPITLVRAPNNPTTTTISASRRGDPTRRVYRVKITGRPAGRGSWSRPPARNRRRRRPGRAARARRPDPAMRATMPKVARSTSCAAMTSRTVTRARERRSAAVTSSPIRGHSGPANVVSDSPDCRAPHLSVQHLTQLHGACWHHPSRQRGPVGRPRHALGRPRTPWYPARPRAISSAG